MSTSLQHTIPPVDDDLFGISFTKCEAEEPCEMDFNVLDEYLKQFDFPNDLDEYLKSVEPSQSQKVDHCTTEKVVHEILFNAKDELSKDSVAPCNAISSPVSVDHCTTEKVVDIVLDVTPSKLNNIRLPNNKKSGRWSKEEQRLFLIGLDKYGKGRWKDISKHVVLTRTTQQVASYAQKYFLSKNASKEKKKRTSTHDMTLSKVEATVLPKIDQQNYGFIPGSATLQPQKVQQLSYSIPHPMRGVEYLDVDPHYIQQQNWVPSPIQPYPRKVYDISSLFSSNPMSGYKYVISSFSQ